MSEDDVILLTFLYPLVLRDGGWTILIVDANTLNLLPVVVRVPADGSVTLVAVVVVNVRLFAPEVAKVDPFANVNVADVAKRREAEKSTITHSFAYSNPNSNLDASPTEVSN